jgi:ATP:ADP antiporter, AAA family
MNQIPERKQNKFTKMLCVCTTVDCTECKTAILLMLNIFVLLTSYYILKTVREPLILAGGGAELKSYTAAGQALLLFVAVPLYSWLVNKMDRLVLINRLTLFFISNLALFYILALLKVPYLGIPFYIWVGIFSLMVMAQFWSLANDMFTPEQGKRLFPMVAFGSSIGAIFGSWIAGILIRNGVGAYEMMLISGGLLLICIWITSIITKSDAPCPAGAKCHKDSGDVDGPPVEDISGFTLVLKDKYLLLIAFLMLLTNLVNTNGEFILGKIVLEAAHNSGTEDIGQYIGSFYSNFFTIVNIVSASLQLFAVSRILKYAGIKIAILVLPVIALGSYAVMAASATILLVKIAKIAENSVDYSLQNTTRHALFLPTSVTAKYKGKQAIDTFFVRMGDVTSALVVFTGTALGFSLAGFAMVNIVLVLVWLFIAVSIGRINKRLTEEFED